MNEQERFQRICSGDEAAFSELYQQTRDSIYRFAAQMSGSKSLAEDVTQEVFLCFLQQKEQYDPKKGSLTSYLYGIARKRILKAFRQRREVETLLESEEVAATQNSEMHQSEIIQQVQRAIFGLPRRYREVVVLCELHEKSYLEASAIIGCPTGTVRSRLYRARRILMEKLLRIREKTEESKRIVGGTSYEVPAI